MCFRWLPNEGYAVIQQLEKSPDFSVTTAQELSSTSMPCRGSSRYLPQKQASCSSHTGHKEAPSGRVGHSKSPMRRLVPPSIHSAPSNHLCDDYSAKTPQCFTIRFGRSRLLNHWCTTSRLVTWRDYFCNSKNRRPTRSPCRF